MFAKNINKILLFVVAAGFVIRLALFLTATPWSTNFSEKKMFVGDSYGYKYMAMDLYSNYEFSLKDLPKEFKFAGFPFDTIRTPGFPFIVAFIYWIFGVHHWLLLLFQIVINSLNIYLVYKICKYFIDEKYAILASALFAIDPFNVIWNLFFLTDITYVFLISLTSYFLLKYLKTRNIYLLILSSFMCAISAYFKPVILYLPFIFIILLLFETEKLIIKIRNSVLYLLLFFLVLSPWYYRNYVKYGYAGYCTVTGYGLMYLGFPYFESNIYGIHPDTSVAKVKTEAIKKGWNEFGNPFENSRIVEKLYFNYVFSNPKNYLMFHFRCNVQMLAQSTTKVFADRLNLPLTEVNEPKDFSDFISTRVNMITQKYWYENVIDLMNIIYNLIIYLSILIGVYYLIQKRKYKELLFFLAIFFYFIIIPLGYEGRYKIPASPFYLIVASYGIIQIKDYFLNKRKTKTI